MGARQASCHGSTLPAPHRPRCFDNRCGCPRFDEVDAQLTDLVELRGNPPGRIRISVGDQAAESILLPALAPGHGMVPDNGLASMPATEQQAPLLPEGRLRDAGLPKDRFANVSGPRLPDLPGFAPCRVAMRQP